VELLKKYIEDINKDLYLDDFNLKEVQMRLPARKHFWVARLIEAKITRNTLFGKKKKLKKELVKKVLEDSPVRINQTAAETAAERYDSVVNINNSIKEQDTIIEYLEKVEKILSTMHWEIKNIVDINRMEQL
jgi:Zn-dependent M16 (insulinase) family peptidase|tara:strand:+ start:1345 stop:1740 length:396 start_codon:yes stop_codon:yes gene_type:complete